MTRRKSKLDSDQKNQKVLKKQKVCKPQVIKKKKVCKRKPKVLKKQKICKIVHDLLNCMLLWNGELLICSKKTFMK